MAKQKAQQQSRELTALEKLGLRVSAMINSPKAQLDADSTPFGHSAHADPDTCSTIIRTGSRSAATQGLHC